MLALSRWKDESIVINHNIVVTILAVRGDKVRLGVEAPKEIPVHRQEIEELINAGGAYEKQPGGPLASRMVAILDKCGGVAPLAYLVQVLNAKDHKILDSVEKCPQLQLLADGRIALAGWKDEE